MGAEAVWEGEEDGGQEGCWPLAPSPAKGFAWRRRQEPAVGCPRSLVALVTEPWGWQPSALGEEEWRAGRGARAGLAEGAGSRAVPRGRAAEGWATAPCSGGAAHCPGTGCAGGHSSCAVRAAQGEQRRWVAPGGGCPEWLRQEASRS